MERSRRPGLPRLGASGAGALDHARRRWTLFRPLLDVLGIEMRRMHFTWISAAEGKKWQQVVNDITETTRKLGPYQGYREICEAQ